MHSTPRTAQANLGRHFTHINYAQFSQNTIHLVSFYQHSPGLSKSRTWSVNAPGDAVLTTGLSPNHTCTTSPYCACARFRYDIKPPASSMSGKLPSLLQSIGIMYMRVVYSFVYRIKWHKKNLATQNILI